MFVRAPSYGVNGIFERLVVRKLESNASFQLE